MKSPHSYLVDLGNGNVRHIHANKMRKFLVRVQSCDIVSESDTDFGRVLTPVPNVCVSCLPSTRLDGKLDHLEAPQRHQLWTSSWNVSATSQEYAM